MNRFLIELIISRMQFTQKKIDKDSNTQIYGTQNSRNAYTLHTHTATQTITKYMHITLSKRNHTEKKRYQEE